MGGGSSPSEYNFYGQGFYIDSNPYGTIYSAIGSSNTSNPPPIPMGQVQYLKFDTANKIISGTFWFDAYSPANSYEKVEVRDGRFDIKF